MPNLASIVRRVFLHQTLVYWAKLDSDTYGKPTVYATPVELSCRWEDKQQEIITPDGRKVLSKGYLLMVDKLVVGSLVFLGTLTDVEALPTFPTPPTVLQGGREVLLVKTTPDLNNHSNIYENYL